MEDVLKRGRGAGLTGAFHNYRKILIVKTLTHVKAINPVTGKTSGCLPVSSFSGVSEHSTAGTCAR